MNTLTKIIIKNAKRQEKQETIKEKILSAIAFLIVFLSLAVAMIVTSIYVTKELNKINQEYMFINILLLMNFIILFGKSIFESLNALYFSKDLKILLRMPIKSKDIVKGKIINMIISEYQMETIMLAIPMIIYGIMEKVQPQFYLYALIILLVLPVIPIMITSTIIAIIMRFTNGIKNKTLVMYMTIILSLVALDFVFTGFNHSRNLNVSEFENSVLRINGISEKIAEQFILIKPIMNTLLNYNNIKGIQNLVLYLLESGVTYILGILVISKIYLKGAIGTTINGKRSERGAEKLNIEDFKKKNKNITYLEKDIKLMSRTPIFCIQCLIIPIVYPLIILFVLLIAITFSRLVGVDLIADLTKEMNTSKMQAIFICVGEVFFMMNFSSIIGISKESKSAILTKTIPIDYQKQFNMKTYIGKFLNMLATIIVALAYYETTKDIQPTIVMFAILYLLNSIGEKVKLYIDLRKPQIEWESEYAMMKQNTNIMNVLFYTLAILVIVVAISQLISSPSIYLAVILIITLIANFTINNYISKNKNKIFKKIY